VATKPGKPGILGDFSERGKLSGISVQPQGKIVTNKVFLVHHSNICVKQLLTG